jgi:DNA-binding NarL/FixJ family response regulator
MSVQRVIRVLVVDDDPAMRTLLRTALDLDPRFDLVDEAEDGLRAIALAATHQPDAVVLDAMMPDLNGIDAIPAIRAVSMRSQVVVFSALVSDQTMEIALAQGADAVLAKTASIEDLLTTLSAALLDKGVQSEVAESASPDGAT